ncbi:rod shape-determining protein MreD [Denitromonas ohlonensis]|jgi:rod shape-determining protein MreD|uniref:Rod shape-determining protein MreD n=2 Tax=Denitromonas TaxID=139331 RepID=A0A558ELH0_9RHOO|nr:rod shape-determining protein MreD [Denitromonas ohlonensis]TVT46054.1 MAG: rod shape-determining protein MreD [Denitromonas halophila]TVO67642.1 rod shape-determining protein MreD [Denitromonas ohlonensis]TVO76500.1 rod shape-determining protein MreD [Denitromonas ohlonensis]TVT74236.1 MAG: rod shape-determining protein MreD [Denitromonas halophila]TVT77163.1 MAG: rod shape-determining protein MreD [Denitromonas halophila]
MQPTHRSRRILRPVRIWFVYLSLFVALLLSYIPTGQLPGVPDWVALLLAFWCVRERQVVGMGAAFVFGILVDIGHGAAMGQHALAYVLLAYAANAVSRRVLWFAPIQQSVQILPLLLGAQVVMVLVRMIAGAEFPGWSYFLSSATGALLWLPLHFVLLLPQYQPEDRDDNRPI